MTVSVTSLPAAPLSLWEATAAPVPDMPPLAGSVKADVAIVGGGISGLSTALHLAEAGVRAVLLEQRSIGHGASGRNGGQVIPGFKRDPDDLIAAFGPEVAEPMIAFGGGAADVLFDIVERQGIACDAVRRGWIQAAHDETARRVVHDRARQWSARNAPVEALDAAQVAERTGSSRYLGGWLDRRAGHLHPLNFTRGLGAAALRRGAAIHQASQVVRIEPRAAGWRVATANGEVIAERVVLCMNAYANDAWPGIRRSYIPVSTFQIASEPLPAELRDKVLRGDIAVSDTHPLLRYYRWHASGRFVMGGPGSIATLGHPAQVHHLARYVERLLPALAEHYRLAFYWSGKVAITLDHLPHLHDLGSGVFAFLGLNGRGVALTTAMGGLLARLASGADKRDIPFRFAELKSVPLHFAYPLYIQAATTWYQLRETFKRPTAMAGHRISPP